MRVVIADDSILLREGLASLLRAESFEVLATVSTADDLLAALAEVEADVALVDIRMPPSYTDEGVRAAEALDELHPGLGVLILSQYIEPAYAMGLLERRTAGRGYLLKDQLPDVETLLTGVRTVASGGSFVDPSVVKPLLQRKGRDDPLGELSDRELEILGLMAQGRTNAAICSQLYLSPKTVEGHVRNIFMKFNLAPAPDDHRRVLAVLRYLRATAAAS